MLFIPNFKLEQMKCFILNLLLVSCSVFLAAQESLIADIMKVEAVNITIGEEQQEKLADYESELANMTAQLDEDLQKLGEDYAADVTQLIESFTETMSEGDEKVIKNEKRRVGTQTNTLTFNLIRDKKMAIQRYENDMKLEIRKLSIPVGKMKDKELTDSVNDYKDNIHKEFEANKRVLKAFKATEHIQRTHFTDSPSSSEDSSN